MTTPKIADMPYHFGMKVNIHPTKHQKDIIKRNSDASRFVYNKLIEIDKQIFDIKNAADLLHQRKHPHYQKLVNYLVKYKHVSADFAKFMIDNRYVSEKTIKKAKATKYYKTNPKFKSTGFTIFDDWISQLQQRKQKPAFLRNRYLWLYHKDIDSLALSRASQNYKAAWKMFHKVHEAGTPKFHSKSYEDNYQTSVLYSTKIKHNSYPNMLNGSIRFLDRHHVKLPKVGVVYVTSVANSIWQKRDHIQIGTVTVHKDKTDRYTLSFQMGAEQPFVQPFDKTNSQVGIDLNTSNFLTDDQGNVVDNPRFYQRTLERLRKNQQILSRRQRRAKKEHRNLRDSKNYQKQRLVVAKIDKKIANQRNAFLDELSKSLIHDHDLIAAENLSTKNMLKNHALAMRISDVGWRLFLEKLAYKSEMYGKQFVKIDPAYTTQKCHNCGYVCGSDGQHKTLTKREREWTCPRCNVKHDRDQNAAINILNDALKQIEKEQTKER